MGAVSVRVGARGICRRFGPVLANDEVALAVAPGTIHAIVGENGAGKTTLMRMLYGLDRPDAGTVVLDDEPVRLGGPADASARGVGMVHQEFKLVGELSLLENLILGREPTWRGRIDLARARTDARALAADAGVELDWDARTDQASVATRQRLEILRLLYRRADVLILDEPTAVLAPPQVAELMRLLRALRDGGRTIVFISHKLGEVLELADAITVLRGGRVTGTPAAADATPEQLVELMVGGPLPAVRTRPPDEPGELLLEVAGLRVRDARGRERVRGVDLRLCAGEVVGVAGVAGNGQDELVEGLVGLLATHAGTVRLAGTEVTRAGVAARRRHGLAYIPADRRRDGLSVTSSLVDNAVAGAHRTGALSRSGWFRRGAARERARAIVARYDVRAGALDAPAGALSGGNQQRLVLGRELHGRPRVVIAAQPTRGVDVKGAAFIREQLLALRARGAAVLLVSEELDELAATCDRIVVLAGGRVAGEVAGPVEDYVELGRLMTARRDA